MSCVDAKQGCTVGSTRIPSSTIYKSSSECSTATIYIICQAYQVTTCRTESEGCGVLETQVCQSQYESHNVHQLVFNRSTTMATISTLVCLHAKLLFQSVFNLPTIKVSLIISFLPPRMMLVPGCDVPTGKQCLANTKCVRLQKLK